MPTSTFSASGLASGIDTATIIKELVQIESLPITSLRNQQTALKSQVSALGLLSSKLQTLQTAVDALSSDGALAVTPSSSNVTFSAAPTSSANAGNFNVQVTGLAQVAKARSQAFAAGTTVRGANLNLTVMGTSYGVLIPDGSTLADVASAIRQSGAPISANVINSGSSSYLLFTDKDTGFPLSGTAADALSISEISSGTLGQTLSMANTQVATNAAFTVDGISFARQSNVVTDAVPGVTLTLKSIGAPENLDLATDSAGTAANLQKFVSAYNDLMTTIQGQLNVSKDSDRDSTLAGSPILRQLNSRVQGLVSTLIPGLGTVRTLADLGIKTELNGTLSLKTDVLNAAVGRDSQAINEIFSQRSSGIGSLVDQLGRDYLTPTVGLLSVSQIQINNNIKQMDDQAVLLQARVDQYQATLQAKFDAMETTISLLKSTQQFLDQQEAANKKG